MLSDQVAFPPRDVRGFRAIRVRDGATERRKPSTRTALLTVWDANSLGSDFLVEGKRYLVRLSHPPRRLGLISCCRYRMSSRKDRGKRRAPKSHSRLGGILAGGLYRTQCSASSHLLYFYLAAEIESSLCFRKLSRWNFASSLGFVQIRCISLSLISAREDSLAA